MVEFNASTQGYWGPPQTNIQWCELDYTHSEYIAEFHNTWSNLPMIFVGVNLIYQAWGDYIMMFSGAVMTMIGIGSVIFHSTQYKIGQMIDEFFMLALVAVLSASLGGMHPFTSGKNETRMNIASVTVLVVGWFSYFVLDLHLVFFFLFTASVSFCGWINLTSYPECRKEYWMLQLGAGALTIGLCPFWLLERLCPVFDLRGSSMSWFHVVFHLCCGVSMRYWGYYLLINRKAARERAAAKKSDNDGVDNITEKAICPSRYPADVKFLRRKLSDDFATTDQHKLATSLSSRN